MGRILSKIYLYCHTERRTMQAANIIQDIVKFLGDPAWGGIGGMAGLVSIPLSIFLARQSQRQEKSFPALASPKKSY